MNQNKIYSLIIFFIYVLLTRPIYAEDQINLIIKSADVDTEKITTYVQLETENDISIQGYNINLKFDPQALKLEDIVYLFGRVSSGLGDETSMTTNINKKGVIYLQGELASASGGTLTKNTPTNLIKLIFKKNYQPIGKINYLSSTGTVFKINADGSLEKILVKNQVDGSQDLDSNVGKNYNNLPDKKDIIGGDKSNFSWWQKLFLFIQRLWKR